MGEFTYELDLPPGLDSDNTAFASPGRWADADNVRFYNGKPQAIGARVTLQTLAGGQEILDLGLFQTTGLWFVVGTADKLLGGSFGAATDITPASNWSNGGAVSFAQWGTNILASPFNGRLFQWVPGDPIAIEVANAPDQIRTILVSPQRQVIALGTNEEISGTWNPRCIRGSDLEDISDWTTSATNNAFEHILDDTGQIITGRFLGNYLMVLTTTSLWMGTFVGDPAQTYRFDLIQHGCGMKGLSNAACVFDGALYWLGIDLRLWTYTPGGAPAPVPCPISKDFRDNFENDFEAPRVDAIPHFGEIRISYSDTRDADDQTVTRFIAVNRNGEWSRGTHASRAMCTNPLATMSVYAVSSAATPAAYVSGDANIVSMEELNSGTPAWHIQSSDQYLASGRQRFMTNRFIPDFEDRAGDLSLTLYVRDRPGTSPTTKGPFTVAAAATKKDFRASGMIAAVKIAGTAYARFGKPSFDCVTMGRR